MGKLKLLCLHGFLGRGADWDFLRGDWEVEAPSLFEPAGGTFLSLPDWAGRFASGLCERYVLVGYSLGGRLALQLLQAAPQKFAGAVLVSTHPGLGSEAERLARRHGDEAWAQRFLAEPWSEVLGAWEAQPVFAKTASVCRQERDYSRPALAQSLRAWSLGNQEQLAEGPAPVLWVAGQRDEKFATLARQQRHSVVLENAGHRVPWDQPREFELVLQRFVLERT